MIFQLKEYWRRVNEREASNSAASRRTPQFSELSTPVPFSKSRQMELLKEWEAEMNEKSAAAGEARLYVVNDQG